MVRPGEVVSLKSGSPKMVVTALRTIGVDFPIVTVTWVAFTSGTPHQMEVPLAALKRSSEAGNYVRPGSPVRYTSQDAQDEEYNWGDE